MRTISPTLEAYRGGYVSFDAPDPASIHIGDIARALSMTCRFGGHVSQFYSVAEHALLVRHLVCEAGHPELGYAALHHDSHEAYVGDIPSPLKSALGDGYIQIRRALDLAIAEMLGVSSLLFHARPVVTADLAALFMEASVLKESRGVGEHWHRHEVSAPPPWELGMAPADSEIAFLVAHRMEVASRVA